MSIWNGRAARHLSSHMADLIACRENENIMKPPQNRCQKKQNLRRTYKVYNCLQRLQLSWLNSSRLHCFKSESGATMRLHHEIQTWMRCKDWKGNGMVMDSNIWHNFEPRSNNVDFPFGGSLFREKRPHWIEHFFEKHTASSMWISKV